MNYTEILLHICTNKSRLNKKMINRITETSYPRIYRFISNIFIDSDSIEESIKRLQTNNYNKPRCVCGKPVKYVGGSRLFLKSCGDNKCSNIINQIHLKETCLQRYGVTNGAKTDKAKQKQKETNIAKYGTVCALQNETVKKKTIKTNIEIYGCEVSQQSDIVKEKIRNSNKETCLERYGVSNIAKLSETTEKRRNTCVTKYGVENIMFSEYIKNNINVINKKRNDTKRKHNTFNISSQEDECFMLLKILFGTVIRQYSDDRYPFNCDFYIPAEDLFIECNFSWTHGGHLYDNNNTEDIQKANEWKSSESKYYNNAADTWTKRDPLKYEYLSKLHHIIFWNIKEVYDFMVTIQLQHKVLEHEYKLYCKEKGTLTKQQRKNNIIKYFQQDTFYKVEKELWRDENIRKRLILNRQQYLNKFNLSTLDILNGFKRSGIYYGYSHFNPLWFKWFITEYNIKTCYDPCGGWGHRLLGSTDLDLYIYNDLSTSTYNNVNRIIEYFNIHNTVTYNNDAKTFIPNEQFEAMFTCPPYFNVEEYECGAFNNIEEYYSLIDGIFDIFYRSNNCKIFGLVIREDMLQDKYKYKYRFDLNVINQSHLTKYKQYKEYLYVFMKGEL